MRQPRKVKAAELIFGMRPPYTTDDVRARFASMVKSEHPDQGGSCFDGATLRRHRDALLDAAANEAALTDCGRCAGTGRTRGTGFASKKCTSCNGTGLRRKS